MTRIAVGISGASGAAYAVRLVELLARAERHVDLVVTPHGADILRRESGAAVGDAATVQLGSLWPDEAVRRWIELHPIDRLDSPPASGSVPSDGMAICPCSMHTLGAVAAGLADTLLLRAAAVALKEGRPLVLVPRETPLSAIHLEAMLRLARAGATVLPACPAFYHRPASVADLVDMVVARVLDRLAVPHDLDVRWSGDDE